MGSLAALAQIPVALGLLKMLDADRLLRSWTAAAVVAMGATVLVTAMMLAGLVGLGAQVIVVDVGLVAILGWAIVVGRRLPGPNGRRLARLILVLAVTILASTVALLVFGGLAFLVLGESSATWVIVGLAIAPGVLAWPAYPVWLVGLWHLLAPPPARGKAA